MTKRPRIESPSFIKRLARTVFSIIILTAFILSITYGVRELSTLSLTSVYGILSKAGIDDNKAQKVAGVIDFLDEKKEEQSDNVSTGDAGIPEIKTAAKIALMSDSEGNYANLQKALEIAKSESVDAVFFLGDHTNWGDLEGLGQSKKILDTSGIDYYALPGDHDLARSVADGDQTGLKNFTAVFGNNYHSVTLNGYKFLLFDNSANYSTISTQLTNWFKNEVSDAYMVVLSQPLYHPTFPRTMGVIDGNEIKKVKEQADMLLELIRSSETKAVFAADHHISSANNDPKRKSLKHYVIGALTDNPNLQTPRFSVLTIYENGEYEVSEIGLW